MDHALYKYLSWFIDWLIDWLIDRLIDWLIDWLIHSFIRSFIHSSTKITVAKETIIVAHCKILSHVATYCKAPLLVTPTIRQKKAESSKNDTVIIIIRAYLVSVQG